MAIHLVSLSSKDNLTSWPQVGKFFIIVIRGVFAQIFKKDWYVRHTRHKSKQKQTVIFFESIQVSQRLKYYCCTNFYVFLHKSIPLQPHALLAIIKGQD